MQQQLQALLETLSTTEPHYIRCVKPNNLLKPAIFENNNVLQQLRCGVRRFSLFGYTCIAILFIINLINFSRYYSFCQDHFFFFNNFRGSWKQLGLAVLDIPQDGHSVISLIVLASLLLKF